MSWLRLALVVLASGATSSSGRVVAQSRFLAALSTPAQWDAVFCPLVEAHQTDREACHVNAVVQAPQRDGVPIAVVFFNHGWSREFTAQGRPRGHFELIAADGRLLPIWLNANVLDSADDLIRLGDDRVATVQVLAFEHGAHLLVVVPVEATPRPLLTLFLGPPLEEGHVANQWVWRLGRPSTGPTRIEIGPTEELSRQKPRASFVWNPITGQFDGPRGSPEAFFERVQATDVSSKVARYAEAADRAWLKRRLREAPGSIAQFFIQNESAKPQEGEACLSKPEQLASRCHPIWQDGSTWFDRVPLGVWTLDIRGPDRERLQEFLVAIPSPPRTLRIRSSRALIRVTDGQGKGLAQVALKFFPTGQTISWTTNRNGEASGPVPAGEYEVSAFLTETDSMPKAVGLLRVRPGTEAALKLEIPRGEQLRGRVVDAQGQPVAGAYVSGVPAERTEDGQGWGNTRSNPDGTFQLEGLLRGRLTVEARSGNGTSLSHVVPADAREAGGEVLLVMLSRPRIRGQLVDGLGRPIPSFVLGESPNEKAVSDPSGSFELALFDEDPELLRFEAPGFAVTWIVARAELGTERDLGLIALPPAVVLEGAVIDATSREPLAGVRVSQHVVVPERRTGLCGTGYQPPPEGTSWAESHQDGRFRLTALAADASLQLSKDGYETKVVPAGELRRPISLERAIPQIRRVEGRVVDAAGRPTYACISFRGPHRFQGKAFADQDGHFSIDVPFPGNLSMVGCAEPEGPEFEDTVVTVTGGTQRIVLQAQR